MELETGEELYEYLQGKSDKEIEDYFVARGARMVNGFMLDDAYYMLYEAEKEYREALEAEKEHRESLKDGKKSKQINKGDDGRGGR